MEYQQRLEEVMRHGLKIMRPPYIGALSGLVPGGPYTPEQAHALARQQADVGTIDPWNSGV